MKIQREDRVISLSDIYIELDFTVNLNAGTHYENVNADVKGLVKLAPFALYSEHKWRASSGKQLDGIIDANVVCLMFKFRTSSKVSQIF